MDLTDIAVLSFVYTVWPVHITTTLHFEPSLDLKDSERDTLQPWLSSNQGTDVPDEPQLNPFSAWISVHNYIIPCCGRLILIVQETPAPIWVIPARYSNCVERTESPRFNSKQGKHKKASKCCLYSSSILASKKLQQCHFQFSVMLERLQIN